MKPPVACPAPLRAVQHGVSIIAAIFLLLLFAVLAALMTTLVTTSNTTAAQDVMGSRAYQAAQAGVEWGLFQLDPEGTNSALPSCFAATTLNQIPNYTVSVGCVACPGGAGCAGAGASYAEAGKTIRIFRITATATAIGASPVGVERDVSATVEKCRNPAIVVAPFDC